MSGHRKSGSGGHELLRILLAERLKAARERAGMTKSELARALGVDPRHVARQERPTHLPSVGRVLAVARATGASVSEILGEGPTTEAGSPPARRPSARAPVARRSAA